MLLRFADLPKLCEQTLAVSRSEKNERKKKKKRTHNYNRLFGMWFSHTSLGVCYLFYAALRTVAAQVILRPEKTVVVANVNHNRNKHTHNIMPRLGLLSYSGYIIGSTVL